jgi:hypothetical protein
MASNELHEELKELRDQMEAQKARDVAKARSKKASAEQEGDEMAGDEDVGNETPGDADAVVDRAADAGQSRNDGAAEDDATGQQDSGAGGDRQAATDLAAQLQELKESLDKELKDTHPAVLLGTFVAGVIVGRLLSR